MIDLSVDGRGVATLMKDDAPPLILEEVAALLHAVGLDLGTMFHDAVDAMVAANEGV